MKNKGKNSAILAVFIILLAFIGCKKPTDSPGTITYTAVQTGGTSGTADSTGIAFTFSGTVTGLTDTDITVTAGTGSVTVTAESLTGSGTSWSLGISVATAGNITVAIDKEGIETAGKTVAVYKDEQTNSLIEIEMVQVAGGTFTMGSPTNEPNRYSDETQHQVTLTGFYMGKYQVTQKQYEAVMGTQPVPSSTYGKGDNYPVYNVSWYDALVFCNRLSVMEGLTPAYSILTTGGEATTNPDEWGTVPTSSDTRWNAATIVSGSTGYRLPTEAQWEYACRAGTTSPFSTGDNITTDQANYNGNYPYNGNPTGVYRQSTTPVDTFPANAWGLHDMHGNLYEWCWDWYGASYYEDSAAVGPDPAGPVSGTYRVRRGGNWGSNGRNLRSAARNNNYPNNRINGVGFRLARP